MQNHNSKSNIHPALSFTLVGRNGFLLAAGITAIIAGLLFPLSMHILVLDTLLIFSVSLTAAVLIITFSAQSVLQLQGFALLVVMATMLRMALSIAYSRLILSQGNADTIISLLGGAFVGNNYVSTVLLFGTLGLVSFGIICKAVKDINGVTSDFTADITREAGFFAAMAGVARFILCNAVVELVIVVVNVAAVMAMGILGETTAGIPVKTYAALTVGAGVMIQIPALVIAVACKYLVRKNSGFLHYPAVNDDLAEQSSLCRVRSEPTSAGVNSVISTQEETQYDIIEDLEWLDESQFTNNDNEKDDLNLWVWKEVGEAGCYEAITELIEDKLSDETKTILMAAGGVEELGVTIPVNVAMRLAQKDKKCLLIDLDSQRNAIAKVFDIDSNKMQAKAIATCVSNLWVLATNYLGRNDAINLKEVTADFEEQYDCLIIYVPNIKVLDDYDIVAGCVQVAMLFGPEDESRSSAISDFYELLTNHGCAILKPEEVFAKAV